MTVNELVEALEKLKDDGKGDYEIAVQYRDGGGYYCGVDDDIFARRRRDQKANSSLKQRRQQGCNVK